MVFRFENPILLVTLILIPVMVWLFWMVVQWKRHTVLKIGDERLVKQLISGYSPKRFLLKFLIVVMAFLLTAMGVANLQYPSQVEKINRQGVDVMIALDVSNSMLATDIQPNRLERARQLINKLIDKLDNDRIGLVLFAGRAYLQMPLTSDHDATRIYVNSASPESVPAQGTVISEALNMCEISFDKKEKKFKTVILISDGEDHDEAALQRAKDMVANGIILHTVGVGSTRGVPIPDPVTGQSRRDASGNIVVSKLNEAELFELAKAGNGVFLLLNDTDAAVKRVMDQIDNMEKKSISDNSFISYRSFFQWFIGIGLILLMVELLVAEKKYKEA